MKKEQREHRKREVGHAKGGQWLWRARIQGLGFLFFFFFLVQGF